MYIVESYYNDEQYAHPKYFRNYSNAERYAEALFEKMLRKCDHSDKVEAQEDLFFLDIYGVSINVDVEQIIPED